MSVHIEKFTYDDAIVRKFTLMTFIWGVVGMFLAAPITAVIRIVLMQFDSLKPLGELLTGKLPFNSVNES